MNENPYKYPCTECPKKDECYIICKAYKDWFGVEWRIATAPFKRIAFERDLRKEGLMK